MAKIPKIFTKKIFGKPDFLYAKKKLIFGNWVW